MEDRLLTVAEVAEMLRTSPGTVRYWRHAGTGPAGVKVGRRVLYSESDVRDWLAGLRQGEERERLNDRAWMSCSRCGATRLTVVEMTRDHGSVNGAAAPCEKTAAR